MDVQMIIQMRAADTPFTDHNVPIAVSRTNMSPLSYAVVRDRDLINDLQQFAAFQNLELKRTYNTDYLLYLLLAYQKTYKPKKPAAARVQKAIQKLEMA
jgi:hypothetical protein